MDDDEMLISITIDFSGNECDCGTLNPLLEEHCSNCGGLLDVDKEFVDPCVLARQSAFADVLAMIENRDVELKALKDGIRNGLYVRSFSKDAIDVFKSELSIITSLLDEAVFQDIHFQRQTMDSTDTVLQVNQINSHMIAVYDLIERLLQVEVSSVWKNGLARFIKAVEGYLLAIKYMVWAINASTLSESYEKQRVGQEKLDSAGRNIAAFSALLSMRNIENDFDMFGNGMINTSTVMAMLFCDNKCEDISANVKALQEGLYNYFIDFLTEPIDYYRKETDSLISLAPYRMMGLMAFDEEQYFNKIRCVTQNLEKAYRKNPSELKEFIVKYADKHVYVINGLTMLAQDFAFMFGNGAPLKLLMRKALGWYKDLSEGIFRDVSSVLIKSLFISNGTVKGDEEILDWMSFPDKLNMLQQKAEILTVGVEKVVRHSEAHFDFDINEQDQTIVVRNKITKSGGTPQRELGARVFSYEEFFDLLVLLMETDSAMAAGFSLFVANHNCEFVDFVSAIESGLERTIHQDAAAIIFPLIGVIIHEQERTVSASGVELSIKGTSLIYNDRKFFDKCISCCAPVAVSNGDVDSIYVQLSDSEGIHIGSVRVVAEFLRRASFLTESQKLYNVLLISESSQVIYCYGQVYEEPDLIGFKYSKGVLSLIMPLFQKLQRIEQYILRDYDRCRPELSDINDELNFALNTINEYSQFVTDEALLSIVKTIVNDMALSTEKFLVNDGTPVWVSMSYQSYKTSALRIVKLMETTFVSEDGNKIITAPKSVVKVGRNDPCPCGSGRKYKKCCLN